MGQSTPTTALMEQFDTLPIQCRHIEHMHGGVDIFCLHRFHCNFLFKTKVCGFFVSNIRHSFAADDILDAFFLGALRVKKPLWQTVWTQIRLLL